MRGVLGSREAVAPEFAWNEVTGAVGDAATVLPLVVAVAVLTDRSLAVMLVWFGVFQVVWGLYYGVPVSVEPMKALAALVVAGAMTTGELLLAGLLLGAVLLAIGGTRTLDRVGEYVGDPVVRGVQFGVALVLLETGAGLGLGNPGLAALAVCAAALCVGTGYWRVSALAILGLGGAVALLRTGVPTPALPPVAVLDWGALAPTPGALEAALGQLAMTVGNAALAAAVLLEDYFDRDVSPDRLSAGMGVMNLVAVPFGAFPMCHGSGGIAGKHAFGARTAGANLVLGAGYVGIAVLAVGAVSAYPTAMLGVILALVAVRLGWTSLRRTGARLPVVAIGLLGLLGNLAVAFVAGVAVSLAVARWRGETAE